MAAPRNTPRPAVQGAGREDTEEVRLAVALTGGVSLAVWMGGVATEIQHLVRGDGAYGVLARLTRTRAAVDVVGGSSAGGINGACLALALSHGTNMAALRNLWVEQGSLEQLLRSEDDPHTASLLRGDAYFLPHIRAALNSLCGTPNDPADNPVELIVTGTLLHGRQQQCTDDFGSLFTDVAHKAQFRFRRGPAHPVDDFARPDIAARLALAARCTSSFPGAFEASWCPVGAADGEDRPDMADHADFPDSSWVIDGGVLVNKPLTPVLTTLASQPDEPDARRVVLFVQPAPDGGDLTAEPGQVTPAFATVLRSGLLGIPHAESLSQELALFEQHNAAVAQRTHRRERLLHADPKWLRQTAEQLLDAYLGVKTEEVVRCVADHLTASARRSVEADTMLAQLRADANTRDHPRQLPGTTADLDNWHWSTFEVAEAERVLAEVLQLAAELPGAGNTAHPALTPAWESLQSARRRLHHLQRQESRTTWQHARPRHPGEHDHGGVTSRALQTDCSQLHAELAGALLAVAPTLRELVAAAELSDPNHPHLALAVGALIDRDGPLASTRDLVTVRCWLLQQAVVLAGEQCSQRASVTPWELLHVSAEAPNAFDRRMHPADKLAGLQLQHFGAFHKSSWRANDWLWGRLDAAARLVQLQLSPRRLRHLAMTDPGFIDDLATAIEELAEHSGPAANEPVDAEQVRGELGMLCDPQREHPDSLPTCTAWVLGAVQAQILREELPYVASRVRADERDGHTPLPGGATLVAAVERLPDNGAAADLTAAFAACRLGEERIADDARSVVYRRTVDRVAALAVRLGHPVGAEHGRRRLRLRLWSHSPLVRAVHRSAMQSRALLLTVAALVAVGGALLLTPLSRQAGPVAATTVGCVVLTFAVALAGLRVGRGWQLVSTVAALNVVGCLVLALAHTGALAWRLWLLLMVGSALAAAARVELRARLGLVRRPRQTDRVGASSRQAPLRRRPTLRRSKLLRDDRVDA